MRRLLTLSVLLMAVAPVLAAQVSTGSATVGDLRIRAIASRDATGDDLHLYRLQPGAGRHFVIVFLKIENISPYVSCTSLEYWLGSPDGAQVEGHAGQPAMYGDLLPPSESAAGVIFFEVKDGASPTSLKIAHDTASDSSCSKSQHREHSFAGAAAVRLSLRGLPQGIERTTTSSGTDSIVLPNLSGTAGPDLAPSARVTLPAPPATDPLAAPVSQAGQHPGGSDRPNPPRGTSFGTPTCDYCPSPPYTQEARSAQVQGSVLLSLTVLPDGKTADIHVERGLGYGLDESAVNTVKKWRFKPVLGSDGRPVAVMFSVQVVFRLRLGN